MVRCKGTKGKSPLQRRVNNSHVSFIYSALWLLEMSNRILDIHGYFAVGAQKHGHHRQNDGGGRVWGPGTLGELPNRLTHRRRSTILKSCSWPSYVERLLCAGPCAKCFTCPGIHSLTQPSGSGAEQLTLKSRLCLR